jgi:hypothetical protein
MRHYGIALGLIALAHILGLWGLSDWPWLAAIPVGLLAFLTLRTTVGADGPLRSLWHSEDAPYASWSAATLVLWSVALHPSVAAARVWWLIGAALSVLFFVAGLPYTWRRRARIDLAHVSWYTPALVAGLDAPQGLNPVIRLGFGWVGFAGMAVVMLWSARRVVRDHDPREMRSPWYGLGGAAVMALWGFAALPGAAATGLFLALCVVALFWLLSVSRHRGWDTQGAWSNLFSLCSMAAVALRVQFVPAAAALTLAALLSFAWDLWRTVAPQVAPTRVFADTEID